MTPSYDYLQVVAATAQTNYGFTNKMFAADLSRELNDCVDDEVVVMLWNSKKVFLRTHYDHIYSALMASYYAKTFGWNKNEK